MKCAHALVVSLLLAGATAAHADPVTVISKAFDEVIVYGTDTFETSGGTVLSSVQYLGISSEIPADIATDIATDPDYPSFFPGSASFIQTNISQAALISDLAFLENEATTSIAGPSVFFTVPGGPPLMGVVSDVTEPESALDSLFPGYAVTSVLPSLSLGTNPYSTGAIDTSTNTLYNATITFDSYEINLVSTPIPSTPEPSTLIMTGSALLLAGAWRRSLTGGSGLRIRSATGV